MNIIIKLLLFLVFLEYIIFTIIRQCKRYFIYKEAVEYSKKIKKPLLVIGDPDSGWMTRNFGRLYGCGDICTDLYDCPKCKISEKGDILDVLKNKGDNSFVIFESCVLECIFDKNKRKHIKNEIKRVAVKSFHVRIQPSINMMMSQKYTQHVEHFTIT